MAASGSNANGGGDGSGGGGGLAARLGSILEAISPTVAPPADDTAVYFAEALGKACGGGSADTGVLFFGDSDISNWDVWVGFPGYKLQRCGVGGAQMSHIAAFAPNAMERYRKISAVVVVAGENDLPTRTAGETFAFFKEFLQAVRAVAPQLPVLYIRTKPEPRTVAIHDRYAKYDRLIAALAEEADPNLVVVGEWRSFLTPREDSEAAAADPTLFAEDQLHLSAFGYDLWNDWVADALAEVGIFPQAPARL